MTMVYKSMIIERGMLSKLTKSFFLVLALVFLANHFILPSAAVDTKTSVIYPNPNSNEINFFGQNHSYSVTFRGNGESVVLLRATFSNLEGNPLNTLEFRVPRVVPKDIMAFQVIRESNCLRYSYPTPIDPLSENLMYTPPSPICEQYDEPNYFDYYGAQKYQKAMVDYQGDTLKIVLPNSVRSNASGSVLLYYRALGYAKKNLLGAYDFTFETLKINDRIKDLQVGIDTDSDLYLKDAKGTVSYNLSSQLGGMETFSMKSSAVASPQVDTVYRSIGQGKISKTASNLQPLDSYNVKGLYASSRMMLYSVELLKIVSVIIAFIILLVVLFKKLSRSLRVKPFSDQEEADVSSVQRKQESVVEPRLTNNSAIISALVISFIASFIVLLYTLFIYFIPSKVLNGSYWSDLTGFIILFLVIVSIAVYVILIIGPAIYMGVKKNMIWGLSTFGLIIIWLVVYILIIFLFLFAFGTSKPPIYY